MTHWLAKLEVMRGNKNMILRKKISEHHRFFTQLQKRDPNIQHHLDQPLLDFYLAKKFKNVVPNGDYGCVANTLQYPLLLRNYCRIAQKMANTGYFPVVHAQSSGWMIPQTILKTLGRTGLSSLRCTTPEFLAQGNQVQLAISKEVQQARQARKSCIPCFNVNSWLKEQSVSWMVNSLRSRLPLFHDWHDDVRAQLISCTIGLFHSDMGESPLYLAVGSRRHRHQSSFITEDVKGNASMLSTMRCKNTANEMIRDALRHAHYTEEDISMLIQDIEPLYEAAFKLDIGQLIVIGIPILYANNFDNIYHSRSFGIPTGKSIQEVLQLMNAGKMSSEGAQLRILLQNKILQSPIPFPVINIMDSDEVEAYCIKQALITPHVMAILNEIYGANATIEDNEKKRKLNSIFYNQEYSTHVEEVAKKEYNLIKQAVEIIVDQRLNMASSIVERKTLRESKQLSNSVGTDAYSKKQDVAEAATNHPGHKNC